MMTRIEERGSARLAIPLGAAGRSHAVARMSGMRVSPGWLVRGAVVSEWRFEGFTQRGEQTWMYGPDASGRTLADVLQLPLTQAAPFLAALADALALLAERGIPFFPLASDALLFTEDGSVLFLPPEVMRELRGIRPFAENRDTFEAINHPDLRGEALACHTLGACLYRVAAGRFPFIGDEEEEIHEQARKLAIVPLRDLVPGFDARASDLVLASLGRPKGSRAGLGEWCDVLRRGLRDGFVGPVNPEESARLARAVAAREQSASKRFRNRTFWEKNWRIVAIVAGCVAVAGLVVGSILQGVFAPRPTRDWPPRQVVETFYTAMNRLDHQLMEACVVERAGQGEINEVTNLFVIGRVQLGYEGKSNTVSADEWDKAGRPKLEANTAMYGVTDLAIEEEQGEPSPVFLVRYVKWTPLATEASGLDASPLATEGRRTTDRVTMRRDKRLVDRILHPSYAGDWVISRIERLSADPVPGP